MIDSKTSTEDTSPYLRPDRRPYPQQCPEWCQRWLMAGARSNLSDRAKLMMFLLERRIIRPLGWCMPCESELAASSNLSTMEVHDTISELIDQGWMLVYTHPATDYWPEFDEHAFKWPGVGR